MIIFFITHRFLRGRIGMFRRKIIRRRRGPGPRPVLEASTLLVAIEAVLSGSHSRATYNNNYGELIVALDDHGQCQVKPSDYRGAILSRYIDEFERVRSSVVREGLAAALTLWVAGFPDTRIQFDSKSELEAWARTPQGRQMYGSSEVNWIFVIYRAQ